MAADSPSYGACRARCRVDARCGAGADGPSRRARSHAPARPLGGVWAIVLWPAGAGSARPPRPRVASRGASRTLCRALATALAPLTIDSLTSRSAPQRSVPRPVPRRTLDRARRRDHTLTAGDPSARADVLGPTPSPHASGRARQRHATTALARRDSKRDDSSRLPIDRHRDEHPRRGHIQPGRAANLCHGTSMIAVAARPLPDAERAHVMRRYRPSRNSRTLGRVATWLGPPKWS